MTMMHYAASLGQEQTIQILAEAGASLNSRDQVHNIYIYIYIYIDNANSITFCIK